MTICWAERSSMTSTAEKQDKLTDVRVRSFLLRSCSPYAAKFYEELALSIMSEHSLIEVMYAQSNLLRLTPLFAHTINTLRKEQYFSLRWLENDRVKESLKKVEKSRHSYLIRNSSLHSEGSKLQKMLESEQVWSLILKGPPLAERVFGGLDRRVIGDIDLLVEPHNLEKAIGLLKNEQYFAVSEEQVLFDRIQSHHIELFNSSRNILLELHWSPVHPTRFPRFTALFYGDSTLWEQNRRELSPKGLWIYLLIHHHEHAYSEFKTLVDLAWATKFLKSGTDLSIIASAYDLSGCWYVSQKQLEKYLGPEKVWPPFEVQLHVHQRFFAKKLIGIPDTVLENLYRRKFCARFLLPSLLSILLNVKRHLFPPRQSLRHLGKWPRIKYLCSFLFRMIK